MDVSRLSSRIAEDGLLNGVRVLIISEHLFLEILLEALLSVMMHLLHKGFMKDYPCWYTHRELFVHNDSM